MAPARPPGTVTTSSTARERLANTVADVAFGIQVHAATVAGVQAALASGSSQLGAYLKSVNAGETRTQDVSVVPELDQRAAAGQPPKVVGYSGHMTLALQVEALALGDVLGGALEHGANQIERTDLHPRIAEMEARHSALAARATRIALDEARAVAAAAGRQVGAVRSLVVESGQAMGPRPVMLRAMGAPMASAPISIEAGDSEVSATVTVTMALIEP